MKLEAYLRDHKCSVEELALRAGISIPAIYKYLKGERTPRKDAITRLAYATNGAVTANDFFDIEHTPPPKKMNGKHKSGS